MRLDSRFRGWNRGLVLVYAAFTALMAILLLFGAVAGTMSRLAAVAQSAFWLALAYGLTSGDRRTVALLWVLVVASGLGTLLRGLVPLEILAWFLNLGFTLWYRKRVSRPVLA